MNQQPPSQHREPPWEMIGIVVLMLAAIASITLTSILVPDTDVGSTIERLIVPVVSAFILLRTSTVQATVKTVAQHVSTVAKDVAEVKHQTNSLAEAAQRGARAEGVIEGREASDRERAGDD